MPYEINQVIPPEDMPQLLRIRYDLKLSQYGIKEGTEGLRYDGYELVHHFTIMDDNAHRTISIKDTEIGWRPKA